MTLLSQPRRFSQWLPLIIAALFAVGGTGLLLAAQLGLTSRAGMLLEMISMQSHTLLALTLAGWALWLRVHPAPFAGAFSNRAINSLGQLLALAIFALGALSLANLRLTVDATLDPFLMQWKLERFTFANHAMAPLSALCAMLTGMSLALLDWKTRHGRYPAEFLAMAAACVMCIPLIGFLFDASSLTSFAPGPAMSAQAPVAFLLLAIGILFSRPEHPMIAVLFSNAPGGQLLRSLFPATLTLVVTLYLVSQWGAQQGFYSNQMITPLAFLVGGALLLLLFWRAGLLLNQEYGSRIKKEAELASTNDLIRIVSDFTTDAIHVKDHNGRFIFANPAALAVMGKELDAVIGRTDAELFPDPVVAANIAANNQAVLSGAKPLATEFPIHTASGQHRTLYLTTAPWFGEQGEIRGTVGIATDITDRKRNEDALKAHEVQLEALVEARTAEVRELIGHLETLREEEKRAIARELHDDLGSSLTALNMHLAILFQQIPGDAGIAARTAQIKTLLNSVTATTRRIQNGLRPDKLDIFGIKTAITEQAADFENYTGVTCVASLPDDDIKYSTEIEISLFRMVQEALNNIAKHAKATRVDIILDDDDEEIYLTVRDNGIGMASDIQPYQSTHGLRGMRERAVYLGGRIEIQSDQGSGTRVKVILPKPAPEVASQVEPLRHSA